MEHFQFQELNVIWSQDETRQRLAFSGRSTSRHPALILGPLWGQVLEVAKGEGHSIELDFVQLEHFRT